MQLQSSSNHVADYLELKAPALKTGLGHKPLGQAQSLDCHGLDYTICC